MNPTEEKYMEKTAWGPGPWQDEPDRIEWRSEKTGAPCLIVRNNGGSLCGYVGVAPGHPLHGKSYREECPELAALLEERMKQPLGESLGLGQMLGILKGGMTPTPDLVFNVHGGLTFSARCQTGGKICHVAQPGEPEDVWWFGFDCAHSGDLMPSTESLMVRHGFSFGMRHDVYRDVDYVKGEVESLAQQLALVG